VASARWRVEEKDLTTELAEEPQRERRLGCKNTTAESGGKPPHSKLGFVVDGGQADDLELFFAVGSGDLDLVANFAI
jgi:hypothetical protein